MAVVNSRLEAMSEKYLEEKLKRLLAGEKIKGFCPYAKDSLFFDTKDLYNEQLQSEDLFKNANIYFMVESEKLEIVLDKVRLHRSGDLKLLFSSTKCTDHSEYSVSITEIIDVQSYYSVDASEKNQIVFLDSNENYLLYLREAIAGRSNIFCIQLDRDKSNSNCLFFNVFKNNKQNIVGVKISNLLSAVKYIPSVSPKIIYIGQSKGFKQRITSHSTLQKIILEKPDDLDIYIYTLFFQERAQASNYINFEEIMEAEKYFGGVTNEGEIDLIEMCLINYFKPRYNVHYIKTDIPLNDKVHELLKFNGYTDINLELRFDDALWCFSSDYQAACVGHSVNYYIK